MLSTLRFLLPVLRTFVAVVSVAETLCPGFCGESVNLQSTPEVSWPVTEVFSVGWSVMAALSKAVASAMSGGGDVALAISGDLSLTVGAPSASPRWINELSSWPRCCDNIQHAKRTIQLTLSDTEFMFTSSSSHGSHSLSVLVSYQWTTNNQLLDTYRAYVINSSCLCTQLGYTVK